MPRSPSTALIENAITADEAQDCAKAYRLYQTAIGGLLDELGSETGESRKQRLKTRIKDLLGRMETLKHIMQLQAGSHQSEPTGTIATNHSDGESHLSNQKEWSFKFEMAFNVRSNTRLPDSSAEQPQVGNSVLSKLLRLLGP